MIFIGVVQDALGKDLERQMHNKPQWTLKKIDNE